MRMDYLTTRRWTRSVVMLLLAVMLTACGGDDGDDEPTATSAPEGAQPTVEVETDSTPESTPADDITESSPTNTDMSNVPASVIADAGVATPAIAVSGSEDASPVAGERDDSVASPVATGAATPVGVEASATPAQGRDEETSTDVTEGDPVVGDGTTGATLDGVDAATPSVVAASPVASPVSATPAAQTTVTGCEVANVPPFTGEQATYSLTSDVNFRTGPGADCALALEAPLGEFQQVVIIGGPVTREDDGSEWVQLNVNGTVGWVSFDFLAPVP